MKTTNPPDDSLSKTLREWKTTSPLPPHFREAVWRRIEQTETKSRSTLLATLGAWVESMLPRPKFAFSYLAALLLLGTVSGLWTAQGVSRRVNADLGSRYVQSVDPYLAIASNR